MRPLMDLHPIKSRYQVNYLCFFVFFLLEKVDKSRIFLSNSYRDAAILSEILDIRS